MNCNTNRPQNLRLINGTLAITAIYEKYLNKNFTSAKISTKKGFTYGKFEIRAALPKGKMLRPTMFMLPSSKVLKWSIGGEIDIMTNVQFQQLGSGIHYNSPHIFDGLQDGLFSANISLDDFNI